MSERGLAGHDRWDELAAGYALHALEPGETVEFERHCSGCTHCQESLRQMGFVAAQLGALASSGDESAPPWRRLRAGVVGTSAAPDRVRGSGRRWLLPAASAAAVVAAVAVVVAVRLNGGGAPPALTAAACARDTACHRIVLHTSGGGDGATVLVRGRTATVTALGVGSAPAGTEWALWQVTGDGRPALVRTFRTAPATTSLPAGYAGTATFALSAEAAGTRPKEPTVVVASGAAT